MAGIKIFLAQWIRPSKYALSGIALAVNLAVVPGLSKAQDITLTWVSVRDDREEPVHSEIFQFTPTDRENPIPLDETDDQGVLKLSFRCLQGTQIQARPYSKAYSYSRKVYCRPTLKLSVQPIHVTLRLQKNLDAAEMSEDFATATLIANELASVETRDGKGVAGQRAEALAVVYAANAFGVPGGFDFDSAQGRTVMAPKLQTEVRKYQSEKGLQETGQLDYKTLSTLSGTTSGAVRYNVYGAGQM